MYSGPLYHPPFQPDPTRMKHQTKRQEYTKALRERAEPFVWEEEERGASEETNVSLETLLEMISPEDSALVALIVFLLCDNTNNDVVLLGILLYVLLSK